MSLLPVTRDQCLCTRAAMLPVHFLRPGPSGSFLEITQILILVTGDSTFCKSFTADAQAFSSVKHSTLISLPRMGSVRTKYMVNDWEGTSTA